MSVRTTQTRAEAGMRMEDIMAGWELKKKTVPYAFPAQALRSLWFHAGHVHREVHFFIVIFVGAAHPPPPRAFRGSSLIHSGTPGPGCAPKYSDETEIKVEFSGCDQKGFSRML